MEHRVGDGYDRLETPERVDLAVDLAGVGSRALAFLLDWILLLAITAACVLSLVLLSTLAGVTGAVLMYATGFVIWWLYFALFEFLWHGQTPGKRLLGLRVQRVGGYPVGWPEAFIRNFLRVLVDLFMFWIPIGLIVMLSTRRNQRIGDLAAGTVVVRERSGETERLASMGYVSDDTAADLLAAGPELTTEEFEVLHSFLDRRTSLDGEARVRIRTSLAALLRRRLEERRTMLPAWARMEEEAFLLHVDAAYRGEAVAIGNAPRPGTGNG